MIRAFLRGLDKLPGPWRPVPPAGPIVALIHCHDAELVPELVRVLRRLPTDARRHVTSSQPAVFARWRALDQVHPATTAFHLAENLGRDIRPFFDVARALDLSSGTLVLKLHGKRSTYSARGDLWRRDLIGGLLPDARTPGLLAARFRADPRLGMVGAPRSFISHPVYWGENRERVARIMADRFGRMPAEEDLGFFAGSMFWITADLLKALIPLVDLDAFEPEPLRQDGAYAHAIERALPMAARRLGWRLAEIGRPEPLDPDAVRERKVAYL